MARVVRCSETGQPVGTAESDSRPKVEMDGPVVEPQGPEKICKRVPTPVVGATLRGAVRHSRRGCNEPGELK